MTDHGQRTDERTHAHHHTHHHERGLRRAFTLIAGFMFVEVGVGFLANSLTLLADAGHMFLDASALGFSWYAVRLSERGSDERLTYGYHRFQVLAAFVNGLLLVGLSLGIAIEAFSRLREPVTMIAGPALAVAIAGLIVNLVAYQVLHHEGEANLNVRSAALHVLGDILGSVAAIAAASIVLLTGWPYADPLLAFVVLAILLRGAVRVLADAGHILLEGVPEHLDVDLIQTRLTETVAGAAEIHHLHAWSLTPEHPMVTLHARVREGVDGHDVVARIKAVLLEDFGVDHSTVQLERGPCPDDSH